MIALLAVLLALLSPAQAYVDTVSDPGSLCSALCAQTVVPRCFSVCLVDRIEAKCLECMGDEKECAQCLGVRLKAKPGHLRAPIDGL